jgi:hypothetical protein
VTLAVLAAALLAAPPVVSLSASPARLSLAARDSVPIALHNFGRWPVHVTASTGGFVLDLRGRPAIASPAARRSAASWLSIRPRRVRLTPGEAATVQVASRAPARAEPGDHHAVLLFATGAAQAGHVGVRMRVGVRVVVRTPGTIVRRIAVRRLSVRRVGRARLLDVGLANLGNVTEVLAPGRVTVLLLRRGHRARRIRTRARELLPHSFGVFTGTYNGQVRGFVHARVEIGGAVRRTFRIRL